MKANQASLLFCYSPQNTKMLAPESASVIARNEPKGVVYTKPWVVNLLLDLAGYVPTANLVDATAVEPAAGDGAFLGPMIERLLASCRLAGRRVSECEHSIVAYELDEGSAERARNLAREHLQQAGVDSQQAVDLAHRWIKCADYLFDDWSLKADFVVGNPPYVRLEELPESAGATYRQAYGTMRGRADLYVAFYEAALRQLKKNGVCAFICADRWLRNQYGSELRRFVTSGYSVDFLVEMHEASPFEDEVDAYPAITVIRRKHQGKAVVATARADVDHLESSILSKTLLALVDGHRHDAGCGFEAAVVEHWFKGSDPWPCKTPAQLALLRRLEDKFMPLECDETGTRVGIGVATGNDDVFITQDAQIVESSRLLPLALVDDIRSGSLQWSGHYLLDPWNHDGLVDLAQFPRLTVHFERHAVDMRKRHVAAKNPRAWFRTIDRVNHDLTRKPKLYIADIKNELSPVLDKGDTYPHHNLYFIQSDLWDLEVLGGLLLSDVAQFFVESYGVRMRGGYFRFQAQYLRRIRVPEIATLSQQQSGELREAFRIRDRARATRIALEIYGISPAEMEQAIGH